MPSPVGHALAGIAVGWLVEGRQRGLNGAAIRTAAAYAFVACVPDLDLLLPTHRGPTHSVAAAMLAGIVAWALTRRLRTAVAFALVFASHILLDWLGTDTTPPIGLMALWPFSREYYQSSFNVFMAVSRRYWLPEFWNYNVGVLGRELMILGPPVVLAAMLRRKCRGALLLFLAFLIGGSVSPAAQPSSAYVDAVDKYRAGQTEAAIDAISQLHDSKLRDGARALTLVARKADGRVPRFEAAMLLHTEVFLRHSTASSTNGMDAHMEIARGLAHAYLEMCPEHEFVREWYLLVIAHFQGIRHISASVQHLTEARERFPGNADVLLASGSHHEMLTLVTAGRFPLYNLRGERTREQAVDVPKELRQAAEYLAAAVAADPELHEARLRLGRVLYRLGERDAAARELEAVHKSQAFSGYRYLAAIFLALIEEERGQRVRASERYLDAMKEFPLAQSTFVGMSELLYVDGQPDSAATVMTRLLQRPAPQDPWWVYLMGEWWHLEPRLAALRVHVRE